MSPGCQLYPEELPPMDRVKEDPCKDNKCREGRCVGKAGTKAGYKCACKSGYGGQFCDRKSKLTLKLLSYQSSHSYHILI